MFDLRSTKRFWRSQLPHWEVESAEYFITIRCAGSLPTKIKRQLNELNNTLNQLEPQSQSFAAFQRKIFATCEKYLDQGIGFSPFIEATIANAFASDLEHWAERAVWKISSYCIMPNHIHLLAAPASKESLDLKLFVSRLKGRSARNLNALLKRSGPFWQREWFDRWIRSETERKRTIDYIRSNPVKAGLVFKPEDYPFVK